MVGLKRRSGHQGQTAEERLAGDHLLFKYRRAAVSGGGQSPARETVEVTLQAGLQDPSRAVAAGLGGTERQVVRQEGTDGQLRGGVVHPVSASNLRPPQ